MAKNAYRRRRDEPENQYMRELPQISQVSISIAFVLHTQ